MPAAWGREAGFAVGVAAVVVPKGEVPDVVP